MHKPTHAENLRYVRGVLSMRLLAGMLLVSAGLMRAAGVGLGLSLVSLVGAALVFIVYLFAIRELVKKRMKK